MHEMKTVLARILRRLVNFNSLYEFYQMYTLHKSPNATADIFNKSQNWLIELLLKLAVCLEQ